jgi:hypothetical protein
MKAEWFKKWDDEGEYDKDYWAKTSEVESSDDSDDDDSSSGGGWWDRFHGKSKKSSYTPVKSTSAYLRSTSSWSDWTSSRYSHSDNMLEVLKEVNKTINLTLNSADGKSEKALVARYGSGYTNNDLTSDTLYISPKVMLDSKGEVFDKSKDEYYSSLDALNGQAMLCSFMRKSVTSRANAQYRNSVNWAIRNIYMTDIQTTAGNEIRSEWPGFESYIDQQQRTFSSSKEQVLAELMNPNQSIDNLINLICYNRLSQDRIDYHTIFESDVADRMAAADKLLNDSLDTPIANDDRFNRADSIFQEIQKIIDLKNPPPPPSNGGNDEDKSEGSDEESNNGSGGGEDEDGDNESDSDNGDQQGEGNDSGEDGDDDGEGSSSQSKVSVSSIDTNSTSKVDRRFTGDNSYNNHSVVEGDYESNMIDPDKELLERVKTEKDKLSSIQDVQLENVTYRKVTPPVNSSTKSSYKSFVASHRSAINNVKNCFQFHNTDYSLSTYGLSVGNIDDNSFHKVALGESERLYERRDVQARKKWLVTILLDQSGSMNDCVSNNNGSFTTRIVEARNLSIIFAEAIKSLRDVDFSLYGFSTQGTVIDTYCYSDKETKKLEAMIEAEPHSGTGMGFHIAHVGDKMLSQYSNYENKILFVITDGEPNCTPTPTMDGYKHTHHCCELLRKRGIKVYGIGVANAFGNYTGERLFGAGNFTVIGDVKGTLNVLTNSLRNMLKKMKK